jgi:hypothetical protein
MWRLISKSQTSFIPGNVRRHCPESLQHDSIMQKKRRTTPVDFVPLTPSHDHMLSHRSYIHRIRGLTTHPLFLSPHMTAGCSERTDRGSGNWLWGGDRPGPGFPLENRQRNRGKPPEQICRHLFRHVALSFRLYHSI